MESEHEKLYEATLDTIRNLFSDQSVPPETTAASLTTLIEEIEMLLDTLPQPNFD